MITIMRKNAVRPFQQTYHLVFGKSFPKQATPGTVSSPGNEDSNRGKGWGKEVKIEGKVISQFQKQRSMTLREV